MATVAIDGAKNAALLAIEMLAISDEGLHEKIRAFRAKQKADVIKKDARLQETGAANYSN